MTTSPAAPRLGYWLNLPDGWITLDSTGERIPVQVERLLDAAAERDPQVAAHRGNVERQITAALKSARSRELAFAAILATFTKDGLPIAASLALTKHEAVSGSRANDILDGLGSEAGKANTLLDTPFAGTIVRSAFVDRIPVPDSQPGHSAVAEIAVFQYFVPTPDRRHIVILNGATPTLPMTDVFGTLFDAIVSTFQFVNAPDGKG